MATIPAKTNIVPNRIDSAFLPNNFSVPYQLYVLQQSSNIGSLANQGNGVVGSLQEQQQEINDNTTELADHETRITNNTNNIATDEANIADLQAHVIRNDVTSPQTVESVFNTTQYYSVSGIQIVAARQTGWTADSGTAIKGGMNADLSITAAAVYSQSNIQAISDALLEARRQIKALTDLLIYHGLAG